MVIPNSVTKIQRAAFENNKNITKVEIPESVIEIGAFAFNCCDKLSEISIPDSITCVGENAFFGTDWYDNRPKGFLYVGKVAYHYFGDQGEEYTQIGEKQVEIKNGTVAIADSAFSEVIGI